MKQLMLGNEAVARGLYEAGCRIVSSYPGTPSTEITEFAAKYDEIYAEWAPNEKVACETAVGASIGGARSFCAMKHVGMNVAADPMFTASYTGVGGGMVIVSECPTAVADADLAEVVMELAGYLVNNRRELVPEKLDWIYHSTACRAAIKAGDKTSEYELEKFVEKLLNDPDIRYCPHGRPVLIEMSKYEIEKNFGRV